MLIGNRFNNSQKEQSSDFVTCTKFKMKVKLFQKKRFCIKLLYNHIIKVYFLQIKRASVLVIAKMRLQDINIYFPSGI